MTKTILQLYTLIIKIFELQISKNNPYKENHYIVKKGTITMNQITSKITGTGSALPKTILTNKELETLVDTSDAWIQERTGIKERRIAKNQENTSDLAIAAAQKALKNANLSANDIDFIIVATFTPDSIMPNTACLVQAALHADHAVCFDLNAACSGFLFALQTAHAYICSGLARHILIIGSENISKTLNWNDRKTCILFGDGAGAVVLSISDSSKHALLDFETGSDGTRSNVLTLSGFQKSFLQMDGQEVFKFAVRKVPEIILTLTQRNHLCPEEIDWYFLHQANARILTSVAKRLSLPLDKFPSNLSSYGNTSAASIPILLDEYHNSHKLLPGQKIILSGFGGGLTWGSCLISW